MTKVVFKYTLSTAVEVAEIPIPSDAKLVHFGIDGMNKYCFWAEVPLGSVPNDLWYMGIYGTGHPVPDAGKFQGTVVTSGGYVFHLYRFESAEAALS